MGDQVYNKIEVTGTSSKSQDDAIKTAVARANKTIKNMRWFEIVESRGRITDGAVDEFQVTLKIGFKLDG